MYDPNANLSERINERVKDLLENPIFQVAFLAGAIVLGLFFAFTSDTPNRGSDPYENCSTTRC